jgi:hypothetical protein
MKTTTWITLLAVGAILAFAIKRSPSFLNLQVVGWVLMGTGGIGAIIPRPEHSRTRTSQTVQNDEEASTGPASPERPRFSRILVPGMSSQRGAMPTGGQAQRETIAAPPAATLPE